MTLHCGEAAVDETAETPNGTPQAPSAGAIAVPGTCTPAALIDLDSVPDDASLDDGNADTVAIFEVNGHRLIGKHVTDRNAALGGLKLWQEITTRIPENQLLDLVQLDIYEDTDPIAIFNRTGRVTTERSGVRLGFSTENFNRNAPDPCARLIPRRGSFDWSLVHEFGHLRGWMDGSWDRFLETFPDVRGEGLGYSEDGSPVLTGDFVTSYAERADGDEDHAESWTTYVMLDSLPAERADEPLALQKVRWMERQTGLSELRQALRISEPGGGNVMIQPAPRRVPGVSTGGEVLASLTPPVWIQGAWETALGVSGEEGIRYRFEFGAADVTEIRLDAAGTELGRRSVKAIADAALGARYQGSDRSFSYQLLLANDDVLEDSFSLDRINDVPYLYWSRLGGNDDVVLAQGSGGPIDPLVIPAWLHGDWTATRNGTPYRLTISATEILERQRDAGGDWQPVSRASEVRGRAERFTVTDDGTEFAINAALPSMDIPVEDSFVRNNDSIEWLRLDFASRVALVPFE
ncbi:MAG: hypothetical protein AAF654_04720 [Myxococcota bacterium]